jgi:cyanate permease
VSACSRFGYMAGIRAADASARIVTRLFQNILSFTTIKRSERATAAALSAGRQRGGYAGQPDCLLGSAQTQAGPWRLLD